MAISYLKWKWMLIIIVPKVCRLCLQSLNCTLYIICWLQLLQFDKFEHFNSLISSYAIGDYFIIIQHTESDWPYIYISKSIQNVDDIHCNQNTTTERERYTCGCDELNTYNNKRCMAIEACCRLHENCNNTTTSAVEHSLYETTRMNNNKQLTEANKEKTKNWKVKLITNFMQRYETLEQLHDQYQLKLWLNKNISDVVNQFTS